VSGVDLQIEPKTNIGRGIAVQRSAQLNPAQGTLRWGDELAPADLLLEPHLTAYAEWRMLVAAEGAPLKRPAGRAGQVEVGNRLRKI
jgi:hypothetical protein